MSHDPLESAASAYALRRVELNAAPDTRRAVQQCQETQQFKCDPYNRFRTADGSCNNLYNPTWGKALGCFSRLLPPDYADGLSAPRVSVTGAPLPNPRILSAVLHRDLNYPATYTHLVMQYGQFFAHDIAFTPSSRTSSFCAFYFIISNVFLFNLSSSFTLTGKRAVYCSIKSRNNSHLLWIC